MAQPRAFVSLLLLRIKVSNVHPSIISAISETDASPINDTKRQQSVRTNEVFTTIAPRTEVKDKADFLAGIESAYLLWVCLLELRVSTD